jgi:prepilin-type N-terminal cleavage/methylation domain-containing protein
MSKERINIARDASRCRFPDADAVRATGCSSPMKCRRGFTLIEMVAVIAIVGIITAIALPRYFNTMNLAKHKIAQAAAVEGHARVNMWGVSQYLIHGVWPTTDQYEAAADSIGTDTGEFILYYRKEDETTLKISAEGKVATSFEGVEATLRIKPPGNGGE